MSGCWSSGGPEWLFPLLLGAGLAAVVCFFSVLRLDDGPVRSPRASTGRALVVVGIAATALLLSGDWSTAWMVAPVVAAGILSTWAMRDLSWDYAAVGPDDYDVPLSAQGRSARRVLVATALVAAVSAVAVIAAMTWQGQAC